jgi:hypothetical protein
MAGVSSGALGPGQSAALGALTGTNGIWMSFTASYTCSVPSDTAANAWLEGSADGGTTWFPLTPAQSTPPSASPTGTGVRFYTGEPVNALKAFAECSAGNTVTVTVTGE